MSWCGTCNVLREEKHWRTLFYSDINDKTKFIVLSNYDRAIEESDIERGHILKEELFVQEGITEDDLNPNSFVVEYQWTEISVSAGSEPVETLRLPIK